MTSQEYLSQIGLIDRRVEMLLERAERAESRIARVTSLYGSAAGGGGRGDWTDAAVSLIDDKKALAEELQRLRAKKAEILGAIRAVPEERWRTLLEYRYVDMLSQEKTAARLYCDRRTVQRWEEKALACIHPPQDGEPL